MRCEVKVEVKVEVEVEVEGRSMELSFIV